jgi:hypothetical protein
VRVSARMRIDTRASAARARTAVIPLRACSVNATPCVASMIRRFRGNTLSHRAFPGTRLRGADLAFGPCTRTTIRTNTETRTGTGAGSSFYDRRRRAFPGHRAGRCGAAD